MEEKTALGLTAREAAARAAAGEGNVQTTPPTKSVGAILGDNIVTPFNLLNLILALLVVAVGSWKNTLFMGVILCNAAIGVVQELRAKAAIDRLTLIAAPHAKTLRDGSVVKLPLEELVRGDVMRLEAGDQVGADCVILEGWCRMDESLLTGEAEPVERGVGDTLLSGSFLFSGRCLAQVVHVGGENYAARITAGVKYLKGRRSEILDFVDRIIRGVGFLLGPVGAALFCKQVFFTSYTPRQAVVTTVAALVGMIPEGLVLLTSVVLAVGVLRLARRGALAQELHSIEMLARADVLCMDKTGTLTTGELAVAALETAPGFSPDRVREGLAALLAATGDKNPTGRALGRFAGEPPAWGVEKAAPFQPDRKWSGGSFSNGETWVLGAAGSLFPQGLGELADRAARLAEGGARVVVLGFSPRPLGPEGALPEDLVSAGLIALSDTMRPSAPETLHYFREQGVRLVLLSGDDPRTAAALARQAGLEGAERWVDASAFQSREALEAAAEDYAVFGRVTPQQKLWLVQALQAGGHTVAMTGDGVNDVPALKESDCGVAMATGSEAARNVSQIVLMDSDLSAMPAVVAEGRRAVNNLQRSAALFLTKTCFSVLTALSFLFLAAGYPFQPIQLTLISALTIGAPSFFLALEPNDRRFRGRFRDTVLAQALPGGIAMASDVLWCVALGRWIPMGQEELSTLCVLLVGFGGLVNLYFVSRPLNLARGALLGTMAAGFALGAWLLRDLFSLALPLAGQLWLPLAALMLWTVAVQAAGRWIMKGFVKKCEKK